MTQQRTMSRRRALFTTAAGVAALSCSAQRVGGTMNTNTRMPVAFLPHGGGPWPFVELGLPQEELSSLASYLKSVPSMTPSKPRALLVISAHWEEPQLTVMSSANPPMYYDYYGFPPSSYQLQWPAPGEPTLASHVRALLGQSGFKTAEHKTRGYDHGTFVPLKLTYPEADIPVVQLSLKQGLDPSEHLEIGRALAPLRDEGVFILGSGNTFHNMRAFGDPRAKEGAEKFDAWLREIATSSASTREEQLKAWAKAPFGRFCHPREEHLLPLMVVAGAAAQDAGQCPWSGTFGGLKNSAFHYG